MVVGAGIAGLLAASVLARRFSRVTVLDRDELPEGAVFRKGVPQSRHLHSLATRGSELLEEFFPGLDNELAEAGAPLLDQTADTVTDMPGGRMPRFRSGITMRAASRALIESAVRRRVEYEPAVRFVPGVEATDLRLEKNAVAGGSARRRDTGGETEYAADLVLDASGQSSRTPRCLREAGHAEPPETVVVQRVAAIGERRACTEERHRVCPCSLAGAPCPRLRRTIPHRPEEHKYFETIKSKNFYAMMPCANAGFPCPAVPT